MTLAREMRSERERAIRETTIDALTGSVAMGLLGVLAEEQVRRDERRGEMEGDELSLSRSLS